MTTLLITSVVVAVLIYGLWRTDPQRNQPGPRLYGSTSFEDRDLQRLHSELRAVEGVPAQTAVRSPKNRSRAHRFGRVQHCR